MCTDTGMQSLYKLNVFIKMEVGSDGSPELLHFGGTFWHTVGIYALMLSYHDLLLGWFQLFLSSVIFIIHAFKCGESIWLIAFLFLSSLMCSFLTYLWLIHLFVFGLMKFSLSWYYRMPVTTTLYFTIQFVCVCIMNIWYCNCAVAVQTTPSSN